MKSFRVCVLAPSSIVDKGQRVCQNLVSKAQPLRGNHGCWPAVLTRTRLHQTVMTYSFPSWAARPRSTIDRMQSCMHRPTSQPRRTTTAMPPALDDCCLRARLARTQRTCTVRGRLQITPALTLSLSLSLNNLDLSINQELLGWGVWVCGGCEVVVARLVGWL
jgi:hypothetical protein